LSARRAVMQHYQTKGIQLSVEDIYLGNGVSELIQLLTSPHSALRVRPVPAWGCGQPFLMRLVSSVTWL
ncbi:hypothetical protein, partial [Streptomyces sp. NPDC057509]|uniref:hypothetical protein n=1 Tax=Streptomyces sp. NPDC057509 TaxID=3346152 RepID=UPI003695DAB2